MIASVTLLSVVGEPSVGIILPKVSVPGVGSDSYEYYEFALALSITAKVKGCPASAT
jgi:hypothetical protein